MHSRFALLFIVLATVFFLGSCTSHEPTIKELCGNEGESLILPCKFEDDQVAPTPVMWRHQGRNDHQVTRSSILTNGSLHLENLKREDSGFYTCSQEDDTVLSKVKVNVRTTPPALVNVTVIPYSILASLRWEVADDGGFPITYFTVQYKLLHSQPHQAPDPWHKVKPDKIKPTSTQIDVFKLEPNSSYVFQVWANNQLGRGDIVELVAVTLHDAQEIELGKHLLEGAQTFDTRVWIAAVAIVMGTLVVLTTATVYALYRECHVPSSTSSTTVSEDSETMELIPNIILNPGFNEERQTEWLEPDENSNNTLTLLLNNNTVVNPVRI